MRYSIAVFSLGAALYLSACSTPNYYPEQPQFMQPAPVEQNVKNNSSAYPTVNFAANGCKGLYETKGYDCVVPKEKRVRVIHEIQ